MRKEDIKRLEAFEMWRRMEKLSWTEHITTEKVLTLIGEEKAMIHTIRKRQRNWIGQRTHSLLQYNILLLHSQYSVPKKINSKMS